MTENEATALHKIMEACKLLGWQIAFKDDPNKDIEGLILGTPVYITKIFGEGAITWDMDDTDLLTAPPADTAPSKAG